MRLKVPLYKQTTELNCGPTALKMILSYFGKDIDIKFLEEKTGIKKGKALYTIQIAIAAASLGHQADFYSKHILFNEEHLKLDYYKKYSDMDLDLSKKLVEEAKRLGVNVQEKKLSLEEILKFVSENSVPIVLLDWNVVKGEKEKGYQGHFVPIVGYDKKEIYVHNHGFKNPQKFMPISRDVLDKARKTKGTDEDVVITHRNPK